MNTLQNLHQHTTFCDGQNTPEEVILAAIEKGFGAIGFSGHCYMEYAKYYSMSLESTREYRKEIARLKEKYAEQIDVFCGLEFDLCCPERPEGYDYVIGSVHGLRFDGVDYEFDGNTDHFQKMIDEHFAGDGLAFAKEYFRQLAWLPDFGDCDIIGHFDLVTKHRDNVNFFDSSCKEYRNAALEAAEALAGRIPYFEVNTGAIARGYRTTPYPSEPLLSTLHKVGARLALCSDSHHADTIDFAFDDAKARMRESGFREAWTFDGEKFIPYGI